MVNVLIFGQSSCSVNFFTGYCQIWSVPLPPTINKASRHTSLSSYYNTFHSRPRLFLSSWTLSLFVIKLKLLSPFSKILIFFARNNPSISFFQAETSLSIFEEFDIFLHATMGGEKVGPAIGIDLGTTNLRMAVSKHGHESIIRNDQGHSMTPSYVAFTENELLVGNEAKNQVARNPSNTVFGKVSNMTFFLIYLSENDLALM